MEAMRAPIPPPPFFPRVRKSSSASRLPDIAAHRGVPSPPPGGNQQEDPLFRGEGKQQKWQQRRREIEAELRKGFDLPDHFQEAAERERVPLFGRPPPVPKPQAARDKSSPHLPPINRATPSPPPAHDPCDRPGGWRKPWQQPSEGSEPTGPFCSPMPPPPPPLVHADSPKLGRPRASLREAHEAREQQRREDRLREEVRRQRQAEIHAERQAELKQQQQEEEDWESEIRRRFKEERANIDVNRKQRKSAFEAETRRAEAEARQAEAEARRAESAAAEAKSQAERMRRHMEEKREKNASPTRDESEPEEQRAEDQHARHRKRHAKRQGNADGPRMTPRPAAYMYRDLNKSTSLTRSRNFTVPPAEMLKQAEAAAMQQLAALRLLPAKKDRQKGFKELLRAWHPDKNPQNMEVATAVFQRLQANKCNAGL